VKIFHLLAPAPFGGLERVVFALAAGQKARGHEVAVLPILETDATEPSLIGELRNVGVDVIPIIQHPRAYHAQRNALQEICVRLGPDVLHSHGSHPDVLLASLGANCGAALISTAHGFTGGTFRNRIYQWMQRVSYLRFDAVVAVSRKLADDLASTRRLRGKIFALPNAWFAPDSLVASELVRQPPQLPREVFNIAWIGRMGREKGPDILIEALPALQDLPIHITMIGEGVERPALQRRAKELRLDGRISWAGEVPRASRLLPAFDLLVISSRTEGTPITLFEAMHANVPVVATLVGGIPDVVSPAEAMLIPAGDSSALSGAIRNVINAPAEARVRATRARNRLATDFAATPWLDAYDRIYRDATRARDSS
jgi:glycosyltransferase involved in cell wall biosynthesis